MNLGPARLERVMINPSLHGRIISQACPGGNGYIQVICNMACYMANDLKGKGIVNAI
jgi:hypothetical protein